MLRLAICSFLLFFSYSITAQVSTPRADYRKGDIFFYWGWNRDQYTKSDIHFYGDNYDFTLKDVVATDHPTHFSFDSYLNPFKLTIPQTNFRIGYFINDHYSLSFGFDHMKYVVQQYQTVEIDGYIHNTGTVHDGEYNGEKEINPRFLLFEHTDGLNFINFELRRMDQLFGWDQVSINFTEGFSAGALVPRTDTELLNFAENDNYHLSGYGLGVMAGINFTFFHHFFIQSELKGGYINMPSLRTTPSRSDGGDQYFFFAQYNVVLGWVLNTDRRNRKARASN